MKFLSNSAVNPSQSALKKFLKERIFRGKGGALLERVTIMVKWSDPRVVRGTTSHQRDACLEEGCLARSADPGRGGEQGGLGSEQQVANY